MLEIRNLDFAYRNLNVLEDINFSATAGEFIAIIGPNGAGKSTLIKIMDGILRSKNAMVLLDGKSVERIPRKELAQIIAYLPQESKFAFAYTAREVVLMGRFPYLQGVWAYGADDIHIVHDVMNLMEIHRFKDRNFNELSGGEKQRVMIASALAQQPKIILLDEPTSALDLHHQIAIYQILRELQNDQNLTVIVVTHDINLAAQFCNRIILMGNGKIISDGKPEEVLKFKLLQETFGVKVYIDINPLTKSLYILPYE
jgi:iron complex transport system ATP-binding protein